MESKPDTIIKHNRYTVTNTTEIEFHGSNTYLSLSGLCLFLSGIDAAVAESRVLGVIDFRDSSEIDRERFFEFYNEFKNSSDNSFEAGYWLNEHEFMFAVLSDCDIEDFENIAKEIHRLVWLSETQEEEPYYGIEETPTWERQHNEYLEAERQNDFKKIA